MNRLAMMLLIPTLALLVAATFAPSSANEATTVHAVELGMGMNEAEVADSVLLPLPFDLVLGWVSAVLP